MQMKVMESPGNVIEIYDYSREWGSYSHLVEPF